MHINSAADDCQLNIYSIRRGKNILLDLLLQHSTEHCSKNNRPPQRHSDGETKLNIQQL